MLKEHLYRLIIDSWKRCNHMMCYHAFVCLTYEQHLTRSEMIRLFLPRWVLACDPSCLITAGEIREPSCQPLSYLNPPRHVTLSFAYTCSRDFRLCVSFWSACELQCHEYVWFNPAEKHLFQNTTEKWICLKGKNGLVLLETQMVSTGMWWILLWGNSNNPTSVDESVHHSFWNELKN